MTLIVDCNVLDDVIRETIDHLLTDGVNQAMIGWMTGICAGHLLFLLTGEDSERWEDDDILRLAHYEFAPAALLLWNLKEA